jgi:hypothetical protein
MIVIASLALPAAGQAARGRAAQPDQSLEPPEQVSVLPLFFVPAAESAPSETQKQALGRHLEVCRKRYAQMLGNRDGFRVAPGGPRVIRSRQTLAELRALPEDAAPEIVATLLTEFEVNRYTCPYVFLATVINPGQDWPAGGGRPLNGGFDTGGGIVVLSSRGLDASPHFQSTLQHELGHGFGLPHVDAYGHDMATSPSLMSYNPRHHTEGFRAAAEPGRLMPEERRGLILNRRAFSGLRFDPRRDVPAGYRLAELAWIPPMSIPGQPSYAPRVSTPSGEDFGSSVRSIVGGRILPSAPPVEGGRPSFDGKFMWQSRPAGANGGWVRVDVTAPIAVSRPTESAAGANGGWVRVDVVFPAAVTLTRVGVHSQHGGRYHAADALRVEAASAGEFVPVGESALESVDQVVPIPSRTARSWRFWFHATDGKAVVLRGLRFFGRKGEIVPPLVPFGA